MVGQAHTADLGITVGDPAGIGPEIVVDTLGRIDQSLRSRVVVFGDRAILERAARARGGSLPDDVRCTGGCGLDPAQALPGVPDPAGAAAQVAYLEAAIAAARAGEIVGLTTAPISKRAALGAGLGFPGHTELLAARLGAPRVAMMFVGPHLRVVLATTHLPLAQVAAALREDTIVAVATLAVDSLRRDFGIASPTVGVLGLNPHAGEGGELGREELEIIGPAIARIGRELGVATSGPLVPDAAFRARYDVFVAMYHDQALIPVKLLDFEAAVNTTLGLPIVRTSPDHGVAYDIAGHGTARATSFRAALELCATLVDRRAASRRDPLNPP